MMTFSDAIDNQKAVLFLLLDLTVAFDTVDHDILLKRFADDFGVKGSVKATIQVFLH